MGIKLGPKLELSFWSIGYIVLAVALVIFNISWISGSLNSLLLGRKERAVYDADTSRASQEYMGAIDELLKDNSLDPKKRLALMARSARLSYNLKSTDKAHSLYQDLVTAPGADEDVKARAALSLVTIEFESAGGDGSAAPKPELLESTLKKLDDLATQHPLCVDIKAAQGALYLNYFTGSEAAAYLAKCNDIVANAKKPGISAGNVEARRNLLMVEIACRGFIPMASADDDKMTKNLQEEIKHIAPYIAGVKKSPQVLLLEQYWPAAQENAVNASLLNQLTNVPGLQGDEYTQMVNTFIVGVVPTLTSPKARENLGIIKNCLKNAIRFAPKNYLNYENGAALCVTYAGIQDQQLEAALTKVRSEGDVLPAPFGNSDKGNGTITALITDEDRSLGDAMGFLKQGLDEVGIDNVHKAAWAQRMVDLALWRAALLPLNQRASHYNTALNAVVAWHDVDPKSIPMMLMTAKIYELLGKTEEAKKATEAAVAAGATVGPVGPVANDFKFVTFYPGNPLQYGTTELVVRDVPPMIGGTFLVQGFTDPIGSDSVTCKFNGDPVRVHCIDGIAYAIVPADKLKPLNNYELKLALTPQNTKTVSGSFRYVATPAK